MLFAGITRSTMIINWMESQHLSDIMRSDVLIYGAGEYGKVTVENILQNETSMYHIIGFIDDNFPIGKEVYSNFINFGPVKSLPLILESRRIDEVIIAINNIDYDTLIKKVEYLRKFPIKVCIASKKFEIISRNLSVDYLESAPLYLVSSLYKNPAFLLFKRITDIIGASLLLIILSPLLLIVALLVKLSSPGPIIFSQIRHGYLGETFKFYKFRSMYLGAEEDCERIEAMKNFINGNHVNNRDTKIVIEERVTRIGKFIRKYSIDELPQLFNVLKGEMSLIGPRPMLPYEWEMLKPWHRRRAEIKPGCSGLWQVSGRSKTSFDEMVILDLYYVDNVSPWLDLEILLKTIPTVLLGKGGR